MQVVLNRKHAISAQVFLTALFSVAVSSVAQAQSADAHTEADATPEIVVVGEGDRRLEQTGSSSVIDADALERTRPLTVNEALRQAPGIFPRDEEGLGLRPNIGVRGLSPTRSSKVLQLEDGIPLAYAPYGDNASYSQPPFRRFERIEVLKGASQVRFGPNTVGGVINYITPDAPDTFGGNIYVAAGNEGYLEGDVQLGGPLFGDLRWIAHGNATQFDGVRENNSFETSDIWAKVEGAIAPSHRISLRAGFATEDSQITYSGLTFAEFNANPRQNPFVNDQFQIERFTAAATHGWTLSPSLSLTTTAYALWFDRDWWRQSSNSAQRPNDASDPTCAGMANLLTTCGNEGRLREYNTYGVESRLMWSGSLFGADAELEAGLRGHTERQNRLQINSDTPRGRTPGVSVNGGVRENNLRYADALAGHVAGRFAWGDFILTPGVRFESIDYERVNRLTNARGETSLDEVIPGLGFSWQFHPGTYLFGGVHRGFAPPRVEDVVTNAGGTVDLDPEESVNWELGLRTAAFDGVYFDVTAFRMDFDNQIVAASIAGGVGAGLTNGGETRHLGLELTASASLRDMGRMETNDLFFRSSLTWLSEAEFVGTRLSNVSGFSTVSVSGNRLPYSPEWLLSAAVGYSFGRVAEAQLEVVHTGEMFTDDLNTAIVTPDGQRGRIDSATTLNLTVNATPVIDGPTVFVAVKNITDELTIVDRSRGILPGAPRLFQVGISQRF
jgi:Fe(3+) dicitrate transport protein